MTKHHLASRLISIGLVVLALVASLVVTTRMVSVSHAADHVPLTKYGQTPLSVVGKLFIEFPSITEPCTGTALISRNESVVDTAAHCFYSDTGTLAKATDIKFCPQYHDGISPLGCWIGKKLLVPSTYSRPVNHVTPADALNDYAFLVVSPRIEQNESITLDSIVVGWANPDSSFDVSKKQGTAYGYPQEPSPYVGKELYSVTGQASNIQKFGPYQIGGTILILPGYLGKGSSGGPWFFTIGGITRLAGHVTIVAGRSDSGTMFSPILGTTPWVSLFSQAEQE